MTDTTTVVNEQAKPAVTSTELKTVNEQLYPKEAAPTEKVEAKPETSEAKPEEKKEEIKTEEKKPEEKKEEVKAEAKAPEKYDFKAPEGVTLDEAQVGRFSEVGKKLNLSQEAAQQLFDLHVAEVQSGAKAAGVAQAKAWETIQSEWKAEISKDPVLGAQREAVTTRIGKILDEYGTKETREAFDLTGAGNNPAVVRFLNKIAEHLVESGPRPQGKPRGTKGQTIGEILGYNKQN